MKCPYKIPVEAYYITIGEMWVIKDKEGKVLFFKLTEQQAEFLAKAINSHEKFETALEKIADDNSYEPCTPIAKQALKEAEQQ